MVFLLILDTDFVEEVVLLDVSIGQPVLVEITRSFFLLLLDNLRLPEVKSLLIYFILPFECLFLLHEHVLTVGRFHVFCYLVYVCYYN